MTTNRRARAEAAHWTSAITETDAEHIRIRGRELTDLMGCASFGQALYLIWLGKPAPDAWAPVLDALLVAAIDHGPGAPSALAARTIISGGGALNAAAAGGLLAMGQFHGAAVTDAMTLLYDVHARVHHGGEAAGAHTQEGSEAADAVDAALAAWRATHRRFPGLGHREHSTDPRVERLWAIARDAGLPVVCMDLERQVAARAGEMAQHALPINIDGAMAAVLCAMEVPAALGNAFFYLARLSGVLAHAFEEQQRMPPMRRIHPTDFSYDGPRPDAD